MGFGIRVFLVDDDDNVRRFSYARLNRLLSSDKHEKVPELANRRVRCAIVFVETIDRQPESVRNADFLILSFGKDGRLDRRVKGQQFRDSAALFEAYFNQHHGQYRIREDHAASKVIHAAHTFEKKKYDQRYRWTPTDKILKSMGAAIFGTDT
jgi:hypothetical protein